MLKALTLAALAAVSTSATAMVESKQTNPIEADIAAIMVYINEHVFAGEGLAVSDAKLPEYINVGFVTEEGKKLTLKLHNQDNLFFSDELRETFAENERKAVLKTHEVFGEDYNQKAVATYLSLTGIKDRYMVIYRYYSGNQYVDVATLTHTNGSYIGARIASTW